MNEFRININFDKTKYKVIFKKKFENYKVITMEGNNKIVKVTSYKYIPGGELDYREKRCKLDVN